MSEATPRITAPYLEQFSHRTVRIVGKVRQLRGEEATIDANGQIRVHQARDSHWQLHHAVEIIGRVQQDLSVRVMASVDLGPEGAIGMSSSSPGSSPSPSPARLKVNWDTDADADESEGKGRTRADDVPDFSAWDAVVDATLRYPEIFYDKQQD